MKNSKTNIKNIGTRQRFAAGNPEIAISFAFSRFSCLMPKKNLAIALFLVETEGCQKKKDRLWARRPAHAIQNAKLYALTLRTASKATLQKSPPIQAPHSTSRQPKGKSGTPRGAKQSFV